MSRNHSLLKKITEIIFGNNSNKTFKREMFRKRVIGFESLESRDYLSVSPLLPGMFSSSQLPFEQNTSAYVDERWNTATNSATESIAMNGMVMSTMSHGDYECMAGCCSNNIGTITATAETTNLGEKTTTNLSSQGLVHIERANDDDCGIEFDVTVTYRLSGTATLGSDYSAGSSLSYHEDENGNSYYEGTFVISGFISSYNYYINVLNDSIDESSETIVFTLVSAEAEYCAIYEIDGSVEFTIQDDDDWTITGSGDDSIWERAPYDDLPFGEFEITRSGGPDRTYGITTEFVLSGSATPMSDYHLSWFNANDYETVISIYQDNNVWKGSVYFPANTTDDTITIYVIPNNDAIPENNETVTITVVNAYANSLYPFNASGSGTFTIKDDDKWKISVETTDDTATERISDVTQDYGEFKLVKTFTGEGEGDQSYSITTGFDMIYDSSDVMSAQYGSDYSLQYQNTSGQWVSLTSSNSFTTGDPPIYRYRFSVTIPAGQTEVKVQLVPSFDWSDEAELFDPFGEGTPKDDEGEYANCELVSASWSGMGNSWNPLGDNTEGEIEIKDGAVCLITTDSNNDGTIDVNDRDPDVKNNSNAPGKVLRVNTDDDDENGELDKWQRPEEFDTAMNPDALAGTAPSVTVQDEDDLAETVLYVWVDSLTKTDGTSLYFDVYSVFPTDLVMWTASTKGSRLHRGVENNNRITESTRLETLSGTSNTFTRTVYMEANNSVTGTVTLQAMPVLNTNAPAGYDRVKMTAITVDLDIDSDNSSLMSAPARSAMEEFLENYTYAPGKIIVPNIGDTDNDGILDCWDGYGMTGYWTQMNPNSSAAFTPIIISVPASNIAGLYLQFTYNEGVPLIKTTGGDQKPTGDGKIRIWTKDGTQTRSVFEHYIGTQTLFTLSQLGWVTGQTSIVLYVEGISENVETTRELAEENGKPNTTIKVDYLLQDGNVYRSLGSDEVLYVIAAPKSFYYELLTHQELVAAYASKAVYGRDDKQEFAIKIQNEYELTKLGLNETTIEKLSGTDIVDGQATSFNAALYREYLTGKYILTFQGTDPDSFDDWRTNIAQAFGLQGVNQYNWAKDIANDLVNNSVFSFNSSNTYITGHSLGGGLASAASIMSGFHAYTFNAAGLHQNTVYNSSNLAIANDLIESYKVDWDILSWGQYVPGWINYIFSTPIPTAIGNSITIDSQYDLEITFGMAATVSGWITGLVPLTIIGGSDLVICGIICHCMDQVIYGMEQFIFV